MFRRAVEHAPRTALRDCHGEYTYAALWRSSRLLAEQLSQALGGRRQQRVAFLCPNDASYIIALWACWISGQIGSCANLEVSDGFESAAHRLVIFVSFFRVQPCR